MNPTGHFSTQCKETLTLRNKPKGLFSTLASGLWPVRWCKAYQRLCYGAVCGAERDRGPWPKVQFAKSVFAFFCLVQPHNPCFHTAGECSSPQGPGCTPKCAKETRQKNVSAIWFQKNRCCAILGAQGSLKIPTSNSVGPL